MTVVEIFCFFSERYKPFTVLVCALLVQGFTSFKVVGVRRQSGLCPFSSAYESSLLARSV